MFKVKDLTALIEKFAPLELQEDYDNCGLLYGNPDEEVRGVLVTLDLNEKVAAEALEKGANFILTHHPCIFPSVSKLDWLSSAHRGFAAAVRGNAAVYAAHTSADFAEGGLNDVLMRILGAEEFHCIGGDRRAPRVGKLAEPCTLKEFVKRVSKALNDDHVLYSGDDDKLVSSFAAVNGGGGNEECLRAALGAGADVFLSGDFKYHVIRLAKDLGYAIINFGHFESEMPFIEMMTEYLKASGVERVFGAECLEKPYN